MFLGYQGDLVVFTAETREELENIPCVRFTKIVEENETAGKAKSTTKKNQSTKKASTKKAKKE